MIDLQGRGLADYKCEILYKNTINEQVIFKCLYNQSTGKGDYKRFLRWHGKRITRFVIGRPSEALEKAYKELRRSETDKFIHRDDVGSEQAKPQIPKPREQKRAEILKDLVPQVKEYLNNPNIPIKNKTDHGISKGLLTTRYWASAALAELKKLEAVKA
jgi:hypothetical protein